MKVCHIFLGSILIAVTACPLSGQTPLLGSIEAPYAAVQATVHMAGSTYGPGSVAYGPVGTPLVLTGSDLGASGTVQFIPYVNGVAGTAVQASATMWTQTMVFVTVPSGAASGKIAVTVEGKQSNGLPFIVMPGAYAASCPASPPNNQLQITTGSLNDGTAGQAYSATLSAQGGTQAYTWAITNGTLPSGLSLGASTGTISGTPTGAAGPVDLTIQVTDSGNPQQTNEAVLSLTIESQTLSSAAIYTYAANYDGAGNVISYADTIDNGSGSIMGSWTFTYDTLNRLISGASTAGAYSGQNACWTYDAFGNRTSEALSPTACADNPPLLSWATFNSSNTNRMDTDSASLGNNTVVTNAAGQQAAGVPGYDQAGDVTSDGGNTYLYDAEGRICAVQSTPVDGYTAMTGYLYDANGNRVAKGTITTMSCDPGSDGFQLTESYVLGQGGEELTQFSVTSGVSTWQRTNVYGAGKQLATYDMVSNPAYVSGNGQPEEIPALHFQLTDPLGTRRMQTSDVGQPETDFQSLPYGDGLNSYQDQYAPATADDATPLHFTGKERDSESGNDYFIARYYASSMGRFLSPDWAAKAEPVPYAKLGDPQTLNLYAYVGNNPLIAVDPDGHQDNQNQSCQTFMCEPISVETEAGRQLNESPQQAEAQQQMTTSAAGVAFIKGWEGWNGTVDKKTGLTYAKDDGFGNGTIGWGHNCGKCTDFAGGITKAQGDALLTKDLGQFEGAVNGLGANLSQQQFDGLVSFAFNVRNSGGSTLFSNVASGAPVTEGNFTAYGHARVNGQMVAVPSLMRRRESEYNVYANGVYDSSH